MLFLFVALNKTINGIQKIQFHFRKYNHFVTSDIKICRGQRHTFWVNLRKSWIFSGKFRCIDGVIVGDICFKLIYRVGVGVNFDRARSLCAFHGYGLAEITSEEVYNAIFGYVKANWYIDLGRQDVTYIHCWLGSSHDVSMCFLFLIGFELPDYL